MPELPEVETVRIGLKKLVVGKTIAGVDFDWPKSFPNAAADVQEFLVGATITNVERRAKVLLVELSSKHSLIIHLKMTGQLVYVGPQNLASQRKLGSSKKGVAESHSLSTGSRLAGREDTEEERFGAGHPSDSLVNPLPDKSTRVTLTFTDGSKLFFNDQRKFGWVRLMPTVEIPQLDFFRRVGPEPLAADFSWQIFKERLLRRRNTNVKAALLDQSVVAGVGNIYADESLWGAKIHPATMVRDLSDKEFKALHKALVDVLELSIAKGGSSNRTYVDAEGKKGSYMSFANVFRREGKPCNRCGTIIEKSRVAGRGTHTCPHCQKLRKA
jgi:formamidopyrimidine-DNA glycosylase